MDSGKGKDRAQNEQIPQSKPEDTSLLSRVAASASGLTRSAFTTPTSNELHETTSTALQNSGKSSQSTSRNPTSAWAESSKTPQTFQFDGPGPAPGTFRTNHSDQHTHQSEQKFSSFLDGMPSFQPSEPLNPLNPIPQQEESNILASAWTRSQPPHPTIAQQQHNDGAAVLAILSSPTPDTFSSPEPEPEPESYDWGLSPEQITQLRAMTKDLFPAPAAHGAVDAGNPLNLVSEEFDWEAWEGVLTGYADEVWGGLLPLVREARREVEEGKGEVEQSKALRRLGAVLGHLQGR